MRELLRSYPVSPVRWLATICLVAALVGETCGRQRALPHVTTAPTGTNETTERKRMDGSSLGKFLLPSPRMDGTGECAALSQHYGCETGPPQS